MHQQQKQNQEEYQFVGIHFLASYVGCKKSHLVHIDGLRKAMENAVNASGATILNMVDHVFESKESDDLTGYTAAFVLSESHATIHTYPEVDSCFVDLFTCGTKCSHEKFDASLREYLEPKNTSFQVIKRDTNSNTLSVRNTGIS